MGPSIAVRLGEVSAYGRMKNTKDIYIYIIEDGAAVMPSFQWFRLVHIKFLLTHKNFDYSKIVPIRTRSFESYWRTLKPVNSYSLAIFPSTIHLREVILAVWTSKRVSTSPYLRGVRILEVKNVEFQSVQKLPTGPQFGVRLWEVSVSRGSTVFMKEECVCDPQLLHLILVSFKFICVQQMNSQ